MNDQLSINEVCEQLGLSRVYVHRMILKGKIKSTKVLIATNTYKHMIDVSEVERWRASVGGKSRRSDGRNKFNLYATKEEYEALQQLLKDGSIESIIERANKVKEISDAGSIE